MLYKRYVEEITKRKVFSTPVSFIHYNISNGVLFIRDMYVIPERRETKALVGIWKEIKRLVSINNCNLIAGYLHIDKPDLANNLRTYRNMGCNISSLDNENRFLITLEI